MIRINATIIILFWISLESTLFLVSATAATFELPPVQRGANFFDCKAKLERQGGGWCEIRLPGKRPSISAVWPPDLDDITFMAVGQDRYWKPGTELLLMRKIYYSISWVVAILIMEVMRYMSSI